MPDLQKPMAIPRTCLFPDRLFNGNQFFCNMFQLVTKRAEMIKFETINLPTPYSTMVDLQYVNQGEDFFAIDYNGDYRRFVQLSFDVKIKKINIFEKAELSFARGYASLAPMPARFIFLSGGCNDDDELISTVERYDPSTDTWEPLPDLNEARDSHSSCVLGNTLYVFGGYNDDDDLDSIEKLVNISGPAHQVYS